MEDVIKKSDQITERKSENAIISNRDRDITLKNGLIICLTSDPDTEYASATMSVAVGWMSDPSNFPGLAHLCEHTLSQGTEKYPKENEYHEFLATHGGSDSAYTYTRSDKTRYGFTVAPEYLQAAFDRFAHMFICPLFSSAAVESEVKIIDAEHRKNLMNHNRRVTEVMRSISKPYHDYTKFSTGNLNTLWNEPRNRKIDIRDELVKFFKK